MASQVRFGVRGVVWRTLIYRLYVGVVTTHTIVGVQHQRWTVVIWLRRHGHNFLSRNAVIWRPARGTRQHRTSATSPKAFQEEPGHILFQGRRSLWHAPRISWKFAGECWNGRDENRSGYHPALVPLFSRYLGIHSSWEAKQRDVLIVGSFTHVNLPIFRCLSKTPCHLIHTSQPNHPAF